MENKELKLSQIKKIISTNGSIRKYSTSNLRPFNDKLNPFCVSGFSDGESTFSISILKNNKSKTGWTILPEFSIELKSQDIELLHKIQSFFFFWIRTY
jgi:hypothetical protein